MGTNGLSYISIQCAICLEIISVFMLIPLHDHVPWSRREALRSLSLHSRRPFGLSMRAPK